MIDIEAKPEGMRAETNGDDIIRDIEVAMGTMALDGPVVRTLTAKLRKDYKLIIRW